MERKNPIAEQSKKWLINALLQLMEEKPYQNITINEITDRALLSRRTFYRNFTKKEELISAHIKTICEEYIAYLQDEADLLLPSITRVFFTFWQKHLDFLKILQSNNLLYLLLENLNEIIPGVYNIFKGNLKEYACEDDLKYALAFSVGGYWNVLVIWLQDGAIKSPNELAKIAQDAIYASLKVNSNKV
jgi:AcrR family transcriptional regulator